MRLLFLVASALALAVFVDTWRNKIWPEIRVKRMEESESWGLVQPGILSVPELCHHIAEAWVSGSVLTSSVLQYKRLNPGKFCLLTCSIFSCLAVVGRYIPGVVLSYSAVWATLLAPLAVYHRLFQHVCVKLEPVLQRLDFSVQGYMMTNPIDNQFLRRPIRGTASGEGSDSEEELAAFCPTFDDSIVAKELAMTDSEHSDAEVSYTENGTFNLSRGQTPLTEGSEDLDRHNVEEDLDSEEELDSLPMTSDLTGELAGVIASNMIQAALAGAMQPRAPVQRREGPPRAGASRSYRKQSSSELDTDWDPEDFEMLDQSELNQMDPLGGGGSKRGEGQGSTFLSSLLGKPQ
ncbi:hypothetical protein WMY93_003900 [Mugilogobius chulae]|uniref:RETREG1-3/ARL6IP-like N-terminal reticulon-homology domain-containing protein n=1 Tax=Mugilogobius chulae TaxID=88201 RepID=A0AAW0Q8R7_9GOBI